MQTLLSKHWHHLPASEVVQLLETNAQKGLDIFEIRHRQTRFGPNRLTPPRRKSALLRFLLQFRSPLIFILLIASVITVLIKDPLDSVIIFAVVLINAFIGFIQEANAEKALEALEQAMTTEATVMRAGRQERVSAAELTVGDIVVLQSGDKVPADLRLLRARDLQIAEAALTGESVPVQKSVDVILSPETVLAERANMAYASTLVISGQAEAVVTAIGDLTEVGLISRLISEAREIETPLTRRIEELSRVVLYAILALAVVTLAIGVWRGQPIADVFTAAIALAVAMVPEGLPAAVTITLAIAVSRMAKRSAIVRKLPAVETLGSVTVICSDKTGTLTQNQMTVQTIIAGGERFNVTGAGYAPVGEIRSDAGDGQASQTTLALRECLIAGLLCNDSRLGETQGAWTAHGDPTEVAMITAARKGGLEGDKLLAQLPRLDGIPFDSRLQYMATLHSSAEQGAHRIVYVKGSVESILQRCASALDSNGQSVALSVNAVHQAVDEMAGQGLRVLAFARGHMPADAAKLSHSDIAGGLSFLGLQGMIDPPRPEAIAAIHACRSAGISVKMITGDHALTASAIAVQMGLAAPCLDRTTQQECVLTGQQLAEMSDEELMSAVNNQSVLARVSPEQKLRVVEALQARGQVVAMTGDGVNDAPALKQADIGIAMGITGTEVAKEAAVMVLTDDNFSTIEAAVQEGRAVFDNLTKIIAWTLPTNIGQGMILVIAILLGLALPLLPVHILWINTVTAAILGLTLAVEIKEPDLMRRPPRLPNAPILTRPLLWRIILVATMIVIGAFGLYEVELARGVPVAQARTVAVNVVVMVELFYLFNSRSLSFSMFQIGLFSNKFIVIGAALMILVQLLFTYAPFMNTILSTAPISAVEWAAIVAVGLASYVVIEVEKAWRRRGATDA